VAVAAFVIYAVVFTVRQDAARLLTYGQFGVLAADTTGDSRFAGPDGGHGSADHSLDGSENGDDPRSLADTQPELGHGDVAANIMDKVTLIDKQPLPDGIVATFKDGEYQTVKTNEPITLYRVHGQAAQPTGAFATASPAGTGLNAKMTTTILPQWGNSMEFESVIKVPRGEMLNIGKVAPQGSLSGAVLPGGADQVLLSKGWPSSWIESTTELPFAFTGRLP
jgi:hypothetical protein